MITTLHDDGQRELAEDVTLIEGLTVDTEVGR